MANEFQPEPVRPGDVISSDWFNKLAGEVHRLGQETAGPGRPVPNLFGRTLAQAQSLLINPPGGEEIVLAVGQILNTHGKVLTFNPREARNWVVVGQEPAAETRLEAGAEVDLLVAARPLGTVGVEAFESAWQVYSSLIRRRVFLPLGNEPDQIAAQIKIVAVERDVTEMANRHAARLSTWGLDPEASLAGFRDLQVVQKELADLFQDSIPGIEETQHREIFAREIVRYLEGPTSDGTVPLNVALKTNDLPAAIEAQRAINRFIGGWTGEGVPSGRFWLEHLASPDGKKLVPGHADPFRYLFRLHNSTDHEEVTFRLEAEAATRSDSATPSDTWEEAATVRHGDQVADQITVARGKPSEFEVHVRVPQEVEWERPVDLKLTAIIPPPANRSIEFKVDGLRTSSDIEEGSGATLKFVSHNVFESPRTVDPYSLLSYIFKLAYSGVEGTAESDSTFDFVVELKSEQLDYWGVVIGEFNEGDPQTEDNGTFKKTVPLKRGDATTVELKIRTPELPGASAAVGVRAESRNLEPMIHTGSEVKFEIKNRIAP